MKCVYIKNSEIFIDRAPVPEPKHNEILIKVKAIGVNRADILQAQGLYKSNSDHSAAPIVPGLEVSGVCAQTGKRVMALLSGGGYAEYASAHKSMVFEIPDNMDFMTAAAIPEAITTIWLNLYQLGGLTPPEPRFYLERQKPRHSVLLHGGSSGVGVFAVQFALASGFITYTTASDIEKLNKVYSFLEKGKQQEVVRNNLRILSYKDEFHEIIKNEGGVDFILDILGGEYLEKNLKALKEYGKLIAIATMSSPRAEISIGRLLLKNLTIIGSTLRGKTVEQKGLLFNNATQKLLPLIKDQIVSVLIDSTFCLDDIVLAHDRMKTRKSIGKVVLLT